MPKRRDQVTLSHDELWAYIETQKSIQFASLNADGSPHLIVLWFAVVDGEIVLETYSKSQKVKNLERDPRIAVLLESGEAYQELKGVSIQGVARLSRDPQTVERYHSAVLRRNTDLDEEAIVAATRYMLPKKTVIAIEPVKIMSWDHSKLDVPY